MKRKSQGKLNVLATPSALTFVHGRLPTLCGRSSSINTYKHERMALAGFWGISICGRRVRWALTLRRPRQARVAPTLSTSLESPRKKHEKASTGLGFWVNLPSLGKNSSNRSCKKRKRSQPLSRPSSLNAKEGMAVRFHNLQLITHNLEHEFERHTSP